MTYRDPTDPHNEAPVQNGITIDQETYEALVLASAKLDALEAAGVENWEGYVEAMGAWYKPEPKPAEPVDTIANEADLTPAQETTPNE